jgi:hypothetical protein
MRGKEKRSGSAGAEIVVYFIAVLSGIVRYYEKRGSMYPALLA